MMNIHKILAPLLAFAALFGIWSCTDSEDTSPSYADTNRLEKLLDRSIPDIAEFCDKYGTYVLYDFDQRLDFAYQFEQASAWDDAVITKLQHDGATDAMAWLKDNIFSHYDDSFKEKYLPRKFLITQSIESNSELGRSVPVTGSHSAVANINSISVGEYTTTQAIDRAILSDYLVSARGESPVENAFFEMSDMYYSTLMDAGRRQARELIAEEPEFFHNNGFFNPSDDESTYFLSSRLDLMQYIDSLVGMTQEMRDHIVNQENYTMLVKMAYVAHGLKNIGVDVGALNPYAVDFLEINISGINPTVRFNLIPAAFSSKETVTFTVLRGENNLQKAEVHMAGNLVETFDLTADSSAPSIKLSATLSGLKPKANIFEVWVYEENKTRPSAKVSGVINYYSSTNIMALTIQDDNTNQYLRENFRVFVDYKDGIVDNRKEKDIMTVTFTHVAKLDTKTFMEYDGEKRFWRMHFDAGRVNWIEEYEEVVDYEMFKSSILFRHTYHFEYDEEGQLAEVTKEYSDGKKETIVSDVSSLNGEIVSFTVNTGKGKNTYFPQYSDLDHKTRIDIMDENLSGATYQYTGTEDTNAYYIPGLPAVIPGNVAGIPLQFLYNEYLFNSITDAEGNILWNNGWKLDRKDPKNPFTGTTVKRGSRTWTYRYLLNN